MKSVFTDKNNVPTAEELTKALSKNYVLWKTLAEFTKKLNPAATQNWAYSGEKYGWSFRISDKKRVLIYLLPRDGFFKAALVFGQKATTQILNSDVSAVIKDELNAAKVYAEGRGIRLEVKNKTIINDIKELIAIKIAN